MTKKRILAAVAVLLAALVAARSGWKRGASSRSGDPARAVAAALGPIEAVVEANGAVTPLNRIEVKPPIQGRIDRLLAAEGDAVGEGDILAWMSSSDRAAIIDAARARGPEEVKRWEDAYKQTPIVSPLAGVVILRNVLQGQTVEPGTVLFAISDRLIVLAQVDESDIGRIRKGLPARIVLDAYPDKPVDGSVFAILQEGRNVSNVITYGVKIELARTPSFFRSQMTASVRFIIGGKASALLIPAGAVREGPLGGRLVMVRGPDGKPVARDIETGIESGDQVEVLSGLEAGEQVLLASGRYVPQQEPQSSPLSLGGRRPAAAGTGAGGGTGARRGSRGSGGGRTP